MIHFCTYFDAAYIHKGIALHQSLVSSDHPFTLWVLCFDEATLEAMKELHLSNVRLVSASDFERADEALLAVKASRSRVEYFWTCTPSLPLFIFQQDPDIDLLVYLDADTFFFGSPHAIVEELGDGNVLIVPHDYAPEYEQHEAAGVFNVGVMAFRRSAEAMTVLRWWREKCLEWCYWRHEDGKIGDQAYLTDWPERFAGVVVSRNRGINAAPWNVAKYGITIGDGQRVFIGQRPLVCFHFHGLYMSTSLVALIAGFKVAVPTRMLMLIYGPYIRQLFKAERMLSQHGIDIRIPKHGFPWRYVLGRVAKQQPLRHFMWLGRSVKQ